MVKVFKNYGIAHPSKVMDSQFETDLGFDKVFVEGLIFDVEEALQVFLNEEEVSRIHNPKELIRYMLEKNIYHT